jgi:hypothetical protein
MLLGDTMHRAVLFEEAGCNCGRGDCQRYCAKDGPKRQAIKPYLNHEYGGAFNRCTDPPPVQIGA